MRNTHSHPPVIQIIAYLALGTLFVLIPRGCSRTEEPEIRQTPKISVVQKPIDPSEKKDEPRVEVVEQPPQPAEPKLDAKPLTPEERLRRDLSENLGSRFSSLSIESGVITVLLEYSEGLTASMSKRGIPYDTKRALEIIARSDIGFTEIQIGGSYPFVDKFGNTKRSLVLAAEYSRATMNRINWDRVLTEDILDLADNAKVHPAMKR